MCTEGSFTINMLHFKAEFKKGDTILIPAIIDSFDIIGEASLLEITI
jgi:mannose-6-phosphate isomerase